MDLTDHYAPIVERLIRLLCDQETEVLSGQISVSLPIEFLQWLTIQWCGSGSSSSSRVQVRPLDPHRTLARRTELLSRLLRKVPLLKVYSHNASHAPNRRHHPSSGIKLDLLWFPALRSLDLVDVPFASDVINIETLKHSLTSLSLRRCLRQNPPPANGHSVATLPPPSPASSSNSRLQTRLMDFTLWSCLETLDLSHNRLSAIDMSLLPPRLRVIRVGWNSLTSFGDGDLDELVVRGRSGSAPAYQLAECDASFNALSRVPQFCTATRRHLRYVNFRGNVIETVDSEEFGGFSELETLDLAENALWNWSELLASLSSIAGSLRSLSLEGNPISNERHYRQQLLDTLPCLTRLDGHDICRRQRSGPRNALPAAQSPLLCQTERRVRRLASIENPSEREHFAENTPINEVTKRQHQPLECSAAGPNPRASTSPTSARIDIASGANPTSTNDHNVVQDDIQVLSNSFNAHAIGTEGLAFVDLLPVRINGSRRAALLCLNPSESVYFERDPQRAMSDRFMDLGTLIRVSPRRTDQLTVEVLFETRLAGRDLRRYTFETPTARSKFVNLYAAKWISKHANNGGFVAHSNGIKMKTPEGVVNSGDVRKASVASDISVLMSGDEDLNGHDHLGASTTTTSTMIANETSLIESGESSSMATTNETDNESMTLSSHIATNSKSSLATNSNNNDHCKDNNLTQRI